MTMRVARRSPVRSSCSESTGGGGWLADADASLLTGAIGVALVLYELISEDAPTWSRLLLSDLAV